MAGAAGALVDPVGFAVFPGAVATGLTLAELELAEPELAALGLIDFGLVDFGLAAACAPAGAAGLCTAGAPVSGTGPADWAWPADFVGSAVVGDLPTGAATGLAAVAAARLGPGFGACVVTGAVATTEGAGLPGDGAADLQMVFLQMQVLQPLILWPAVTSCGGW